MKFLQKVRDPTWKQVIGQDDSEMYFQTTIPNGLNHFLK